MAVGVNPPEWDDILYTVFERTFLESTAEKRAEDAQGFEGGMTVVGDD